MPNYVFVPSIRGKIKLLLMVFEAREPAYLSILKQLDKKLSSETRILILLQSDSDKAILNRAGLSPRVQIYDKINSQLSRWVRDPFICFVDNTQRILIYKFILVGSDQNHELAKHLELMEIFPIATRHDGWFDVDGGNLLTDRKHIFIGWPDFQRTMAALCASDEEDCYSKTKQRIIEVLNSGKVNDTFSDVIVIGEVADTSLERGTEKFFEKKSRLFDPELWKTLPAADLVNVKFAAHIDMFLSLTGQDCDGKPIVFVAMAIATHPRLTERANEINAELESVVAQLKNGFCVMRNPMPIVENQGVYFCQYNNCLVEVSEFDKKVWIPAFGESKERWKKQLQSFDKANLQLWESIGFKAEMIKSDFHSFCKNGLGALHCITNELIRI